MNDPSFPSRRYVQLAAMSFYEAHLVHGALVAGGIAARIDRPTVGPYGVDVGPFAHRVLVPEEELDRARALLAEIEAEQA